ncbi:hypothetical protein NPIL_244041 [Nephila pilipes]|uniref:Uncharacterized protein n=1 Tax=Nephila pilipes TaxID=299642 RepID=A0A8X6QDJ0_NEPPI|nr:hypothetical protein NPIL_244041 [Nephila pilipes]
MSFSSLVIPYFLPTSTSTPLLTGRKTYFCRDVKSVQYGCNRTSSKDKVSIPFINKRLKHLWAAIKEREKVSRAKAPLQELRLSGFSDKRIEHGPVYDICFGKDVIQHHKEPTTYQSSTGMLTCGRTTCENSVLRYLRGLLMTKCPSLQHVPPWCNEDRFSDFIGAFPLHSKRRDLSHWTMSAKDF